MVVAVNRPAQFEVRPVCEELPCAWAAAFGEAVCNPSGVFSPAFAVDRPPS
jgi:hypothetical protein